MKIVVPVKLVPDLVEELFVDASGTALDPRELSLILNELDDHALEQALLLKEEASAEVTVIAPEIKGVDDDASIAAAGDDALFLAAARGADRLLKLTGNFAAGVPNQALARLLAPICLLYTSPSPRDQRGSRMPSSA